MEKGTSSLLGLAGALVVGILLGVIGHSLAVEPDTLALSVEAPGVREDDPPAIREVPVEAPKPSGEATPNDASTVERKAVASPISQDLGILVYGTVRDEEGKLIDDAMLNFTPAEVSGKAIYTSTKKGGYSIHGFEPGVWKTLIRGRGLRQTKGEVTIRSEPVVRVDLVTPRAYIVTVRAKTLDGKPLRKSLYEAKIGRIELNAVATRQPLTSTAMMSSRYHSRYGVGRWSGASFGRARKGISDDPDVLGVLDVDSSPPVYVSLMLRHHVLASILLQAGQKEVTFELSVADVQAKTSTVTVRVIDRKTRLPIAKARVGLSDSQSGGGGRPTDEDGVIVLQHQASGLMQIDVFAKGYERYHANVRLEAGKVDLGTIELGPPVTAKGIVVDATGKPQVARISWTNLDRRTFPQPLVNNRSASSDSKGLFELWGAGEGRYLVQAKMGDKALATQIVDTGKLGPEPFKLVLQPSHLVALDTTKMAAHRRPVVLVRDAQRRLVNTHRVRGLYVSKFRLPVGKYSFEVFDDLERSQAGEFEVRANGTTTILVSHGGQGR